MPIQHLPGDVVVEIAECLPSKRDQSSMARISTHFLSLVRPVLFSSICLPKVLEDQRDDWFDDPDFEEVYRLTTIGYDLNPRDYKTFVSFLASAPHLATFVRNLTLWESPLNPLDPRVELGALNLELLHSMISKLPSLRTLWLHNVQFKKANTLVPYRHNSIDRLVISCPANRPWDVTKPASLFSHIHTLSPFSSGNRWQPIPTNEGPDGTEPFAVDLQVSNLHVNSPYWGPDVWRINGPDSWVDPILSIMPWPNGQTWGIEVWTDMLRKTPTPKILQSFSLHCDTFTATCTPSSTTFDFLREAAWTLTHLTFGTGFYGPNIPYNQWAYHKFDSAEMRTRLAPLTSLRSITLKFHAFDSTQSNTSLDIVSGTFAVMVSLLASFPPCVRRITFSFADAKFDVLRHPGHPGLLPRSESWCWSDLNLRQIVPLLQRYTQLEAVIFEGAEGSRQEDKERILNDLPEIRGLVQFAV